ncbi:MAG: alpha/beta hydrolase fold domain-containing protein [Acidimicrobiales bacterium]
MIRRLAVVAMGMIAGVGALTAGTASGAGAATPNASPAVTVEKNLCYEPISGGCTDGISHEFDAYLPAGVTGAVPGVILVHGGAHKSGTKQNYAQIAGTLATDGMAAFSINYRLDTPTTPGYPMQVQDVLAAVSYIRAHAAEFHLDPSRLAMFGESAGADLTLRSELQAVQDDPAAQVKALVGWSGGYDYSVGSTGAQNSQQLANVEQYVGCSDLSTPSCYQTLVAASAVTWVRAGDPPTLLAASTDYQTGCERVNPFQVQVMAADLRAVGTPVTLALNGKCAHALAYANVELLGTIRFLERNLGLPVTTGYQEVAADGGIFSFGSAAYHGSMGGQALNKPIVGMAATPTGGGYWEVASDGGIFSFGNAAYHGSMGGQALNKPIVGMAATSTGGGYWEVASDGGIFSFGNAGFHGSMGGQALNAPIVGIAAAPTGGGYWEVAADGGIFSFGTAAFHGSMGGQALNRPIVGIAATPTGGGYWEVASDGGIFSFGNAGFHGSMGGQALNAPIVALSATATGLGYWEVAADGGIFSFGTASFRGSMGGQALNRPIVGISSP